MSYFKQPAPLVRPWKCRNSRKGFTLKAHAANHKKQSSSQGCRAMGFEHVVRSPSPVEREISPPIEHKFPEPVTAEESGVAEGSGQNPHEMENEDNADDNNGSNYPEQSGEILQFGDEDDTGDVDEKKRRLSRKGCMKATPMKIAKCLRRMQELKEENPTMSQRTIAAKVAFEYSTLWRNCYRWMYEWPDKKRLEIFRKAEQHIVGVALPSQLQAMSLGQIRRADIAEVIDAEFVKRKQLSKRVDFT